MSKERASLLKERIAPYRERLISHPVYTSIKNLDDVRRFMEHHVFAVWDFMSLLKYLQCELTCVDVPWMPKGNASTRFLINEIVTGEESDVDEHGNRTSHFELYLKAMHQAGSNLNAIHTFVDGVHNGNSISQSLQLANAPEGAAMFVKQTFDFILSNKPHIVAAVFTYGREDLIPDMFLQLIKEVKEQFPEKLDVLQYYIERHIEVDGGHHGELALQMTEELCGDDELKWQECELAVIKALQAREKLWDAVAGITSKQPEMQTVQYN